MCAAVVIMMIVFSLLTRVSYLTAEEMSQRKGTDNKKNLHNALNVYSHRHVRSVTDPQQNCGKWSPWIDDHHPTLQDKGDREFMPPDKLNEFCPSTYGGHISKMMCKDNKGEPAFGNRTDGKIFIFCSDLNHGVTCSMVQQNINDTCPDMAVKYFCNCTPITTAVSQAVHPSIVSPGVMQQVSPQSTSIRTAGLSDPRQNCGKWSPWIDDHHPTLQDKGDREFMPPDKLNEFCPSVYGGHISKMMCRDNKGEPAFGNRTDGKIFIFCSDLNHGVTCSMVQQNINDTCPDMAVQYFCNCTPITTAVTQAVHPSIISPGVMQQVSPQSSSILTAGLSDPRQNCGKWSPWIDDHHPTLQDKGDREFMPPDKIDEFCPSTYGGLISKMMCKDNKGEPAFGNRTDGKIFIFCSDLNHGVTCSMVQQNINDTCPDMAVQYFCNCTPITTAVSQAVQPSIVSPGVNHQMSTQHSSILASGLSETNTAVSQAVQPSIVSPGVNHQMSTQHSSILASGLSETNTEQDPCKSQPSPCVRENTIKCIYVKGNDPYCQCNSAFTGKRCEITVSKVAQPATVVPGVMSAQSILISGLSESTTDPRLHTTSSIRFLVNSDVSKAVQPLIVTPSVMQKVSAQSSPILLSGLSGLSGLSETNTDPRLRTSSIGPSVSSGSVQANDRTENNKAGQEWEMTGSEDSDANMQIGNLSVKWWIFVLVISGSLFVVNIVVAVCLYKKAIAKRARRERENITRVQPLNQQFDW